LAIGYVLVSIPLHYFLNGFKLDSFQWKVLNRAKIAKIGAPRRLKNREVLGYLGTRDPVPNPMTEPVWGD
jgi:hypothetical protein